jgi:hypothetical protein
MYESPRYPGEVFLGGDSGRSVADLGQLPAESASGVLAGRGTDVEYTAFAAGRRGARLFLILLSFVALVWAFSPVEASTGATVLPPREASAGRRAVPGATENHPAPSRPAGARSHWVSTLRSGKRHAVFHVPVRQDSPNGDDTTSNDPDDDDDDDTSHDLRYESKTDHALVTFLVETVLCEIGHDAESAPAWTQIISSSVPAGQRLRC